MEELVTTKNYLGKMQGTNGNGYSNSALTRQLTSKIKTWRRVICSRVSVVRCPESKIKNRVEIGLFKWKAQAVQK